MRNFILLLIFILITTIITAEQYPVDLTIDPDFPDIRIASISILSPRGFVFENFQSHVNGKMEVRPATGAKFQLLIEKGKSYPINRYYPADFGYVILNFAILESKEIQKPGTYKLLTMTGHKKEFPTLNLSGAAKALPLKVFLRKAKGKDQGQNWAVNYTKEMISQPLVIEKITCEVTGQLRLEAQLYGTMAHLQKHTIFQFPVKKGQIYRLDYPFASDSNIFAIKAYLNNSQLIDGAHKVGTLHYKTLTPVSKHLRKCFSDASGNFVLLQRWHILPKTTSKLTISSDCMAKIYYCPDFQKEQLLWQGRVIQGQPLVMDLSKKKFAGGQLKIAGSKAHSNSEIEIVLHSK